MFEFGTRWQSVIMNVKTFRNIRIILITSKQFNVRHVLVRDIAKLVCNGNAPVVSGSLSLMHGDL